MFPLILKKNWVVKSTNMIWKKWQYDLVCGLQNEWVGSNSCGPALKEQYRLNETEWDWAISLQIK